MAAETEFDEWEEFLIPHLPAVVDKLRPSLLLDHLRARRLIGQSEYRTLHHPLLTETERSQKLLHDILPSKGREAFYSFCEILLGIRGQEHIVTQVLELEILPHPPNQRASRGDVRSTRLQPTPTLRRQVFVLPGARASIQKKFRIQKLYRSTVKREEVDRRTKRRPTSYQGVHRQIALSAEGATKAAAPKEATLCFDPRAGRDIRPNELLIRALCLKLFGIPKRAVAFVYSPGVRKKLAFLLVSGVKKSLVKRNRERLVCCILGFLDSFNVGRESIHFRSVIPLNSALVIFDMHLYACLALLWQLCEQRLREQLGVSLQEVLPGLTEAVLTIGNLPPIELLMTQSVYQFNQAASSTLSRITSVLLLIGISMCW